MSAVKLRKAIPIIGTISSGKSLFLDSLLGLDLLESQSNTTTKFVCIIQHHKNLKEPKFYQISLIDKKFDENKMLIYEGALKGEIIKGKEIIREKIKEINRIQKEIPGDKIKFDDLFYVLEIEMKNIKNEELLNNYDFYDIPGLDEYINDKYAYIEELFKYFKGRIDFGVFVLNSQNAYFNSTKNVIFNVANYIKPKKIKNYLIILNKIDRQSKPEITIKKLKSLITNNLLDELNLSNNIFLPLDSRQLLHQTLIKESFEHYLLFLFNEYIDKSVIPFKDKDKQSKEENKYYTENYSFLEFLDDRLKDLEDICQIEEKDILEEIFNENYDFEMLKIEEILEKIKHQETYKIKIDIDIDEEDSIKTLKALYVCFKERKYFPQSKNVNDVFNFFNDVLNNLNKKSVNEILPTSNQIITQDFKIQFENFIKKFKRFYGENKNFKIIEELSKSIEQLYNYIENQKIIYIGIFGNSSTGKSVIYNNLFKRDILPVNESECTKRGIIIEDSNNIAMYKAKAEIKNLNGWEFNIFKKEECIASDEKSVKEMLEELNTEYANRTDKKELNYFIITLPIKFFDEIKLDKEIRKNVKFIDLPGYNTNESTHFLYEPVIKTISCFLITFKADSMGSSDNSKTYSIYKNLKFKSERAVQSLNDYEFIKCCLFIINLWDKETPDKKNLNEWQNSIKRNIINIFGDIYINISYLNALTYHNYLYEEKYYYNFTYLMNQILSKYNLKGSQKRQKKTFIQFFAYTLKKSIIDSFGIKEKQINELNLNEIDKKIYEQIDLLFKNSCDITGFFPKKEKDYNKYLNEICLYLTYAQKNIRKINNYKESYIEKFHNDLSEKIKFSNELVDIDFKEHLANTINILNVFFNIDINNQNKETKDKFIKESKALYEKLKECFKSFYFGNIFDSFLYETNLFYEVKIKYFEQILYLDIDDIDKKINEINEEYKTIKDRFEEKIKKKYEEFIDSIKKIYREIVRCLDLDKFEKKEIKNMENDNPFFSFFSKIFSPFSFLPIFVFAKTIYELIVSKRERLIEKLNEIKNNQLKEIGLYKERFLRDLENKKNELENYALTLINIKILELKANKEEIKEFYIQLEKDYKALLNTIKSKFKI